MSYSEAKSVYEQWGVDCETAIQRAMDTAISINCWQGDDVVGFDNPAGGAGNGIQTTGNYPGRARTFEELKQDYLKAASLVPGKKRLNLHACYAVFTEEAPYVDRNKIEYKHFEPWVQFAKEQGIGLDFNPTFFSHPMVKDGMTLSSPDEEVRRFWIEHARACRRIAEKMGQELNDKVLCNVWIPDGFKDTPVDRKSPRIRLKNALDEIFEEKCPHVIDCVESKFFAVGVESYTTGSHEFYLGYALSHPGVYDLLDAGHFHPSETVSDKISSMLCYFDYIPLHVTRPVHWDSDHVVTFDEETQEIFKELVRNDALDKSCIGLDCFDASINRVAAWVIAARNAQKCLLNALLEPYEEMKEAEHAGDFTKRLMLLEEVKTLPFEEVWNEYCRRCNVPVGRTWYEVVKKYENDVTSLRK